MTMHVQLAVEVPSLYATEWKITPVEDTVAVKFANDDEQSVAVELTLDRIKDLVEELLVAVKAMETDEAELASKRYVYSTPYQYKGPAVEGFGPQSGNVSNAIGVLLEGLNNLEKHESSGLRDHEIDLAVLRNELDYLSRAIQADLDKFQTAVRE